jgi:hypothetical protein
MPKSHGMQGESDRATESLMPITAYREKSVVEQKFSGKDTLFVG